MAFEWLDVCCIKSFEMVKIFGAIAPNRFNPIEFTKTTLDLAIWDLSIDLFYCISIWLKMPSIPRYMTIDFEFLDEFDFNLNKFYSYIFVLLSVVWPCFVFKCVSHTTRIYFSCFIFFRLVWGTIWFQSVRMLKATKIVRLCFFFQ